LTERTLPASFRDPSGKMIKKDGELLRLVYKRYSEHYKYFMASGLYAELTNRQWLIPHEEVASDSKDQNLFKTLKPEVVPIISYPYEWCFDQMRDAALLTLDIQILAIEHGMILKDATAYNVQFHKGKPIFIDTLSFERIEPDKPWAAYGQFCRHFLAPLALMSMVDVTLNRLLRAYLDGIPLTIASKLLPSKSRLRMPILLHVHMHAKMEKPTSKAKKKSKPRKFTNASLRGLMDNLRKGIKGLSLPTDYTTWSDYYDNTILNPEYLEAKKLVVAEFLQSITCGKVLDLGANEGYFSYLAKEHADLVLSTDIDPMAVNKMYSMIKMDGTDNILPLIIDLSNPSPGIGWLGSEREGFLDRLSPDTVMSLALIHHLVIGNNIPLSSVAAFHAQLGEQLIIEFVPKSDPKVEFMLSSREDIFDGYTVEQFEQEMAVFFNTVRTVQIPGTDRSLYLMKRKNRAAN